MQFHTVAVDQHKCFSFLLISSPYECVNASLTWFIAPAWALTFFSSYQCPSSADLVPTPVCRVCPWIQTLDTDSGQLLLPSEGLFPFFSPSAADAPCLACSRASADKAKVTLMKSEGAFFSFRLFVCELSLPAPPSPPYFLLPRDSFSFPVFPRVMSADAIREGYANFWHWETDSGLDCATAWTQKTYLSSGRKAASLAAPSLPPQSMKVSSHPVLIPHQGSRHCGRRESTTRPVASAHRGQREEDDSPLNGFHSGCVWFIYLFVCFLLAQM